MAAALLCSKGRGMAAVRRGPQCEATSLASSWLPMLVGGFRLFA